MSTKAQNLANQSNARLSTGPRTLAGIARSAVNAVTHGLTGRTLIVPAGAEEAFDEFISRLHQELKPYGALETVFFDQILQSSWNLRRMSLVEAEFLSNSQPVDPIHSYDCRTRLQLIELYRSRAERSLLRAMHELRRLQQERILRTLQMSPDDLEAAPLLPDSNLIKDTLNGTKLLILQEPSAPAPANPNQH